MISVGSSREQKHLEYSRLDQLAPNMEIAVIPEDAHFSDIYPASLLYRFRYDIIKGEHKQFFDIDPVRGMLTVTSLLDRDVICAQQLDCDIHLDVAIVQPVDYFEVIKVTLTLIDANDNDPAFPESETTLYLSENAAPPVSFVLPSAIDPDSGPNGIQSYDIVTETSMFGLLTSNDGFGITDVRLELREKLNRENEDSYQVSVIAKDGGTPTRSGTMTVYIKVVDANDNSPTFEFSLYNVSLKEDHVLGVPFLKVKASDPDQGLNGLVFYGLSSQMPSLTDGQLFTINNRTGEISLVKHLDYETQPIYHLLVSAQDLGPDSVPVHAKVIVHVQDVNDFVPDIHVNSWTDTGQIEVLENADPGTFVAHVSVDDRDLGISGQVTCHVSDPRFELKEIYLNTYKMVTVVSLDREQNNKTVITVECRDLGEKPLSSSVEVTVHIKDENDHPPVFTKSLYTANVPENSPRGYSILTVTAKDKDYGPNGKVTYHLHANSNNLLKIDTNTGVISTNSILDHERIKRIEFNVLAFDRGKQAFTATATVSLRITDVNDETPAFPQTSYNFGTYENQLPGTVIGKVTARDKDSPPNDKFLFSIQDTNAFSIDSESGSISTKKILDREHQSAYYLTIVATDMQPPYLSSSVTVTVYVADKNDNAPTIEFPNAANHMIEVSAFAPEGFIVTRIVAEDSDQGDHARLTYSIAKGNEGHLFDIDPDLGLLTVVSDLSQVTKDTHNLLIMVQDHGDDFNSAVTSLVIQINRTQAFADSIDLTNVRSGTEASSGGTDGSSRRFRSQDVILIILGAITVVLVSILITAIVCIKKRQQSRDRDSYKYMCRIDLANQLSSLHQDRADGEDGSRRDSDASEEDELEKRHFGHFDPRDSGIQAASVSGSFSDVSNGSHVALQIALANGGQPIDKNERISARKLPNVHVQSQHQTSPAANWHGAEKPINTLIPGERDSDSTSGCSADMSNPDSGKGHSDGSDTRLVNHGGQAHNVGVHSNAVKSCQNHGKNVTFGEVTCHSPKRSRDYASCPLPQCEANHFTCRLPLKSPNQATSSPGRGDDRTGCHGSTSTLNNRKQQSQYSNPSNGRIHPQPSVVLSTFGYDDTSNRRQHRREPASPSETHSFIMDPNIAQSIV
ncbi:hypothetical protein LSH36_54g06002 [Paralvinella palmiformis]|uniref:Cadherin domain-containing protein n=1 Tax=Paralvinella palmiformis TaxID=53620 RepID=A0AAD9K5H7_9ANNE|nr:hypothetical protein LSH36_54g06002 [Paralvinella palmiformis]